ncbi:DUF1836 domain-containing protein [Ruminococcus sp. NK3A76]|uniref:DUF1836 domain-containing protein n=1 Tax=Ruminococcus sp. NK3A76 TaxID=877411 RepID=UPI0004908251|nr:DUF1836 domain-containing protein [Ruminococcus sp. NK3A76]
MNSHVPGTVLPLTDWARDRISQGQAFDALISPILSATGGVTLSQLARFTGLEGSTIQNWIKRGWVASNKNKKYTEKQVARILLINVLRAAMKLEDIVKLMEYINGEVEDESDDILHDKDLFDLLCSAVLRLDETEGMRIDGENVMKISDSMISEDFKGEVRDKLQKALAIMLLAYRSAILKNEAYRLYSEINK